jgi:hypothetical protein
MNNNLNNNQQQPQPGGRNLNVNNNDAPFQPSAAVAPGPSGSNNNNTNNNIFPVNPPPPPPPAFIATRGRPRLPPVPPLPHVFAGELEVRLRHLLHQQQITALREQNALLLSSSTPVQNEVAPPPAEQSVPPPQSRRRRGSSTSRSTQPSSSRRRVAAPETVGSPQNSATPPPSHPKQGGRVTYDEFLEAEILKGLDSPAVQPPVEEPLSPIRPHPPHQLPPLVIDEPLVPLRREVGYRQYNLDQDRNQNETPSPSSSSSVGGGSGSNNNNGLPRAEVPSPAQNDSPTTVPLFNSLFNAVEKDKVKKPKKPVAAVPFVSRDSLRIQRFRDKILREAAAAEKGRQVKTENVQNQSDDGQLPTSTSDVRVQDPPSNNGIQTQVPPSNNDVRIQAPAPPLNNGLLLMQAPLPPLNNDVQVQTPPSMSNYGVQIQAPSTNNALQIMQVPPTNYVAPEPFFDFDMDEIAAGVVSLVQQETDLIRQLELESSVISIPRNLYQNQNQGQYAAQSLLVHQVPPASENNHHNLQLPGVTYDSIVHHQLELEAGSFPQNFLPNSILHDQHYGIQSVHNQFPSVNEDSHHQQSQLQAINYEQPHSDLIHHQPEPEAEAPIIQIPFNPNPLPYQQQYNLLPPNPIPQSAQSVINEEALPLPNNTGVNHHDQMQFPAMNPDPALVRQLELEASIRRALLPNPIPYEPEESPPPPPLPTGSVIPPPNNELNNQLQFPVVSSSSSDQDQFFDFDLGPFEKWQVPQFLTRHQIDPISPPPIPPEDPIPPPPPPVVAPASQNSVLIRLLQAPNLRGQVPAAAATHPHLHQVSPTSGDILMEVPASSSPSTTTSPPPPPPPVDLAAIDIVRNERPAAAVATDNNSNNNNNEGEVLLFDDDILEDYEQQSDSSYSSFLLTVLLPPTIIHFEIFPHKFRDFMMEMMMMMDVCTNNY